MTLSKAQMGMTCFTGMQVMTGYMGVEERMSSQEEKVTTFS